MIKSDSTIFNPELLPFLSAGLASFFWVADAVIDVYLFQGNELFYESLIAPEPVELWMRCLVVTMFILFGLFTKKILLVQKNITNELSLYKNQLEQRADKLEKTNSLLQRYIKEKEKIEKQLEYLAAVDALTSLFNRRKFDELLDHEIAREKRYQLGLSVIFCDIDNFKQVNDIHGHSVGDKILIAFASALKENLRKSDFIARWGGEEFVILITNEDAQTVKAIAEKIRNKIECCDFIEVGKLTASFGVTHCLEGDDKETIIKRADKALYQAKEYGRNRVEFID